jgi:hypothetical protein
MNATSGPRRRPNAPHPERAALDEPSVPTQRTAADVYGVSEDQVHRARIAVARNALDSDDCRELLDMLGLIGEGGDPPPVRR